MGDTLLQKITSKTGILWILVTSVFRGWTRAECGAEQVLGAYLTSGTNVCGERDIRMEFQWNIMLVPRRKTSLRLTYSEQCEVSHLGSFSWSKGNLPEDKFRPSVLPYVTKHQRLNSLRNFMKFDMESSERLVRYMWVYWALNQP